MVKACNAEHRVVWGSVHQRIADRLRQRNPHSHTFFSFRDIFALYALYLTGLLPFVPLPAQYVELPFVTAQMRALLVHSLTPRLGLFLAGQVGGWVAWLSRRRSLFLHLRARGCPVVLWVVNTEEDMKEALDTGATGIMTDFPQRMQRLFNIPPQPRPAP